MDNGLKSEIVEIKCHNCGKDIYVYRCAVREKMFCTIKCMDDFKLKNSSVYQMVR